MIPPESRATDRPFAGAHSQVSGLRGDTLGSTAQRPAERLPLESPAVAWEPGWSIRLPVRAEHILVDKQLVVYERVIVRRHQIDDLARVDANVRREQLRVEVDGDADVTPALGRDNESHP